MDDQINSEILLIYSDLSHRSSVKGKERKTTDLQQDGRIHRNPLNTSMPKSPPESYEEIQID